MRALFGKEYEMTIEEAVCYLKKQDLAALEVGTYQVNDDFYFMIQEYETKPAENCRLETHNCYADIQWIVSGEEEIDTVSRTGLEADEEYDEKCPGRELFRIAKKLSDMGPSKIVITGIVRGRYIANYCYEKGSEGYEIKTMKVGTQRSGTGDIFASILAADAVNGVDFHTSVKKASQFIKKCILKSIELDIPVTDGVCFEELLTTLR